MLIVIPVVLAALPFIDAAWLQSLLILIASGGVMFQWRVVARNQQKIYCALDTIHTAVRRSK